MGIELAGLYCLKTNYVARVSLTVVPSAGRRLNPTTSFGLKGRRAVTHKVEEYEEYNVKEYIDLERVVWDPEYRALMRNQLNQLNQRKLRWG